MRILALLLFSLGFVTYQGQKSISPPTCCTSETAVSQAANILFQSADGGMTWQDISPGLPGGLSVSAVLTLDGEVFLGAENGTIYHSRHPESGIWEKEEAGNTFLKPGCISSGKRILSLFPGRSGIYALIQEEGLFRKATNTGRWQIIHLPREENEINTLLENPDGTILIGCRGGIYTSKDDGNTWKQIFSGGWVSNIATAGDVLLCSGSRGLMRSADGGEQWECVVADEEAIYNIKEIGSGIAAYRLAGPRRYTSDTAAMLYSADSGRTWQSIDEGLATIHTVHDMMEGLPPAKGIIDIEVAGDYLFCSHKAGISRSSDGGKTWYLVRPATTDNDFTRLNLAKNGRNIIAVMMPGGC